MVVLSCLRQATPLRSFSLDTDQFRAKGRTPEQVSAAKMDYCCQQCERYDGQDDGSDRRHLKARKPPPVLPSEIALVQFSHLDDDKCAIWHVDADESTCYLWNANRGIPRTKEGHTTGIPEGTCPTQLSNTAVTPRQVCKREPLDPKLLQSPKQATLAYERGDRPIKSKFVFPDALLPRPAAEHPLRTPLSAVVLGPSDDSTLYGKVIPSAFSASATCVSRIDVSVSGFRTQTALGHVHSVDDCCFACFDESSCKAWTYHEASQTCFIFNKTSLSRRAFYQRAPGYVGGLVTERFCDMTEAGLQDPNSFVLPATDIKGWDLILPGLDQGFFAYSAQHCCVLVTAMDEYRLHGWTYDSSWNRCYPKVSRVGGMSKVPTVVGKPWSHLTSGILLQDVPKCATDKCFVSNKAAPVAKNLRNLKETPAIAFCDGTLDFQTGTCVNSRRKQRGYDCRDCMRCHDACQSFLSDPSSNYLFSKDGLCQDFLSESGECGTSAEHVTNGLDCRGCRIRERLYDGRCSHLCQYPDRCPSWFSSSYECVPNFVYGSIIADCNKCTWSADDRGFSVE